MRMLNDWWHALSCVHIYDCFWQCGIVSQCDLPESHLCNSVSCCGVKTMDWLCERWQCLTGSLRWNAHHPPLSAWNALAVHSISITVCFVEQKKNLGKYGQIFAVCQAWKTCPDSDLNRVFFSDGFCKNCIAQHGRRQKVHLLNELG